MKWRGGCYYYCNLLCYLLSGSLQALEAPQGCPRTKYTPNPWKIPTDLSSDLNPTVHQYIRAGPNPECLFLNADLQSSLCSPLDLFIFLSAAVSLSQQGQLGLAGATAAGLDFLLQLSLRNTLPEQQKKSCEGCWVGYSLLGRIFPVGTNQGWSMEPVQPKSLGIEAGLEGVWSNLG